MVRVFGFDMRWMIFEHLARGSTCLVPPGMGFYVRVLGSVCVCVCVCPACFDSDNVHTGVCVIGLGFGMVK